MRSLSSNLPLHLPKLAFAAAPLMAFALLVAGGASARGHRDGQNLTPEQRQERFEQHSKKMEERIREKLAPRLGLDTATTDQLIVILRDGMTERRAAMQAVHLERTKLKALVDSKATDAAIDTQMASLRKAMDNVPKRDSTLDDVARILTPTQQAKFLLASEKFMKRGHHKGMHKGQGRRGADKPIPASTKGL